MNLRLVVRDLSGRYGHKASLMISRILQVVEVIWGVQMCSGCLPFDYLKFVSTYGNFVIKFDVYVSR